MTDDPGDDPGNNGKYAGSVAAPRSVNKEYAPPNFVWKMSDWSLIS